MRVKFALALKTEKMKSACLCADLMNTCEGLVSMLLAFTNKFVIKFNKSSGKNAMENFSSLHTHNSEIFEEHYWIKHYNAKE